jgi:hypothetical protein
MGGKLRLQPERQRSHWRHQRTAKKKEEPFTEAQRHGVVIRNRTVMLHVSCIKEKTPPLTRPKIFLVQFFDIKYYKEGSETEVSGHLYYIYGIKYNIRYYEQYFGIRPYRN